MFRDAVFTTMTKTTVYQEKPLINGFSLNLIKYVQYRKHNFHGVDYSREGPDRDGNVLDNYFE